MADISVSVRFPAHEWAGYQRMSLWDKRKENAMTQQELLQLIEQAAAGRSSALALSGARQAVSAKT